MSAAAWVREHMPRLDITRANPNFGARLRTMTDYFFFGAGFSGATGALVPAGADG
jgi:hypothetical protein